MATSQFVDAEPRRQAQRGRVHVIRALRGVDVVVRVQRLVAPLGMPEVLERAVGDHLVRVHVGRGAGAALDHVDDELLVQGAADQVVAGEHDRVGAGPVDHAEFGVRERGRLLDERQRADQRRHRRDRLPADREVVDRTSAVHAPVGVGGNVHVAEEVVLAAGRRGHDG